MELNEYLDLAKEKGGFTSYKKMGPAIGVSEGAVTQYRTGRAWPSEEVMCKIANLANVDETMALIDLHIMKNSGRPKNLYTKLRAMVEQSAATMAVLLVSVTPALASSGASLLGQSVSGIAGFYILRKTVR